MARSAPQSFQRRPLTAALGTEANVRILRELALHGGQLSAPSLVTRTVLAKASVRTGLAVLLQAGVVAVAGSGHAKLYSLRRSYPLRAPLQTAVAVTGKELASLVRPRLSRVKALAE